MSPGPPLPSASNVSSDETGVRVEQFVPGLSHCRGVQGQRRQTRQLRGPWRGGGRYRPQHGRAPPITEHLDKLSLSSDCTEGPIKAKPQGNFGQQMQGNLCQNKTGKEVYAQKETPVSPDEPGLETECLKDAGGGRGQRGRRRGPYRSAPHTGAPGPARYHWDGRASRSRGGGPRRGHGRGDQQRGREEVL